MGKGTSYEDFVKKARLVHGDKYEYDKDSYKSLNAPVHIYCNTCGNDYTVKGSTHLKEGSCPFCRIIENDKKIKSEIYEHKIVNTKEPVKQYHEKETNTTIEDTIVSKYENILSFPKINEEYKSFKSKLTTVCDKHGSSYVSVIRLLNGYICPYCEKQTKLKESKKRKESCKGS